MRSLIALGLLVAGVATGQGRVVVVGVDGDAAIEWTMGGTGSEGPFRFRGSEHYAFDGDLIAEIRQYWTFDTDRLDTGLVDYPYGESGEEIDR